MVCMCISKLKSGRLRDVFVEFALTFLTFPQINCTIYQEIIDNVTSIRTKQ